jgi:hypothetical protein
MKTKQIASAATKWLAVGLGVAAGLYAGYVGATFLRYGKPKHTGHENDDELLNRFMPVYDVVDRHAIHVQAPADFTLSCATEIDLESCPLVRGIFKAREVILGAKPATVVRPCGFLAKTKSLGWGVLAERRGREIVMGAVTKPWEPNPVFRALPPDDFLAFYEPGYVKIVWTLRSDPDGDDTSIFRTETRARAVDPISQKKFRWYWSFLSPGILMIRRAMLPIVKRDAEALWKEAA